MSGDLHAPRPPSEPRIFRPLPARPQKLAARPSSLNEYAILSLHGMSLVLPGNRRLTPSFGADFLIDPDMALIQHEIYESSS